MLLKSFHIHDFQSVRDSNAVDVGDVTCLVGKNEAGKSALLKALYRLNPINPSDANFDVVEDYPRSRVTEYDQGIKAGSSHSVVVSATFELQPSDLQSIEAAFGAGVLPTKAFTLSKRYDNERQFSLQVDEVIAGTALLSKAALTEAFKKDGIKWASLKALYAALELRSQSLAQSYAQATAAANATQDPAEKQKLEAQALPFKESQASNQLRIDLKEITALGLSVHIYKTYLSPATPKFLYFDDYYQMRGCENIQALQKRINENRPLPSDHPLIGLVELANLNLTDLLTPSRTQELKNKLQGAGNHLTRKILKYWSQNKHLRLEFDVRPALPGDPEGMQTPGTTNIWAEVADQVHFVNTALGTRSRGFVWFFSFLAWYSRLKTTEAQPIILLLDEPGLSLHAKAQEDLLRYFDEELKADHQLIYSTHSPFMVDPAHFDRVRIVRDKTIDSEDPVTPQDEGTKVLVDVLDADSDSLFPLQGALGYEIYQTLFVGPNSLVVEGASDLLYIQALSSILAKNGRTQLDKKWTVTPVGGSDKVPTFVALIGAQKKLRVAALIDLQKKDAQSIENLYKRRLLGKSNVHTFAEFTSTAEADIEDMFDPDIYITLVNGEYGKALPKPLKLTDLASKHPRILVRLEEHFKANPLNGDQFNHYRPARFLIENLAKFESKIDMQTLERFENAFLVLNALLPK